MGWPFKITQQRQSITRQAVTRLLISLGLFVVALSYSSALLYDAVLKKASHERAQNLLVFYQSRLAQIERDWEIQTRDFKTRIEFTRYLEEPHTAVINLHSFFTIQGGERNFVQLLVLDQAGATRFRLGKEGQFSNPLKKSETSGWYRDAISGKLYRVFQEVIWLGKDGTGNMVAYFPLDNALLYQLAMPGVTLAARYHNELVSTSLGAAGMANFQMQSDAVERKELRWSGSLDEPLALVIEAPVKTIFSAFELTLGVGLIPVIDALILWFALGTWLMLQTRRINAMGMAVEEFAKQQDITPLLQKYIRTAQQSGKDEIHDVAVAVESLALQIVEQRLQHICEEVEIRLWSSVFKSSAEGIIITDRDNNIVAVNPAFLQRTGYLAEDLLGKNPRILSAKLEKPEFYAAMWQSIANIGYWLGEVRDCDKSGAQRPYLISISSVQDVNGKTINYVGYYTDISDRIRAEAELKRHRDNLEELVAARTLALENINQTLTIQSNKLTASEVDLHRAQAVAKIGSWRLDARENTLSWSDETCRIFGLFAGTPVNYELFLQFVYADDRALVEQSWQAALRGEVYKVEHRILVGGITKWVREQAELVFDQGGNLESGIGTIQDITELKQYEQKIEEMAYFDALTKLPNRRMLYDRLEHIIAASKRNGFSCALMFIDLDNFKPLNDRYGHVAGDLLLMEVARRLVVCVREADTVARFGGDEFIVLLPDLDQDACVSKEQAFSAAEKIRNTLAETYWLGLHQDGKPPVEHYCTSSIGVKIFSGSGVDINEVLKHADAAMYRAKAAGRNVIHVYDQGVL